MSNSKSVVHCLNGSLLTPYWCSVLGTIMLCFLRMVSGIFLDGLVWKLFQYLCNTTGIFVNVLDL